jgi:hypothetical protein
MNAGFLAASAMDNNTIVKAAQEGPKNDNPYIDHNDDGGGGSVMSGNVEDYDYINSSSINMNNVNNNNINSHYVEHTERSVVDEFATDVEFAKTEEELQIRSAWLYHISLDKNMVDERPGNRVRTYDGVS